MTGQPRGQGPTLPGEEPSAEDGRLQLGGLPDEDVWPAANRLDCRGMRCPRPVVELARAAARVEGAELLLLADDPATEVDVPAWCRMRGAILVEAGRDGRLRWFRVRPA